MIVNMSSLEQTPSKAETQTFDVVVIGTGIAGLYTLYRMREQGLEVIALEAGSDVGGTWYWNRYPGARFDSESHNYQYLFSEKLYKGWSWSEKYPGQPEVERWLHYVTDQLRLRKHIRFSNRVQAAHFNETTGRWKITTDQGAIFESQFVITCVGMLSAPITPKFPGMEGFEGLMFHTARWPKEHVELAGKRVGTVGNGATGIQIVQTIASEVEKLTVFVRTPQYIIPMKNQKFNPEDVEAYKSKYAQLVKIIPWTTSGSDYDYEYAWEDLTPEQRRDILESYWNEGSLKFWSGSFEEMFDDPDVNAQISEFVREKMRERLKDPRLCDLLIPKDYGFGTHRVPLEQNYLEAFHRSNVEIVSVKENPIEAITPKGIKTKDGTIHEFDIIILATGFDAGSGAISRIDIRGRGGRSLRDEWSKDIHTFMGFQVHGYPNLFMTGAPLAPSAALCNMTTCLSQQAEWIDDCIRYMRGKNFAIIEPTSEAQDQWVAHHDEVASKTLISKTNSWWLGSNVEGKPRRLIAYLGGSGVYRQKCIDVAAGGYQEFAMQ
jgi:acetone monooxygenase (methyl acetate-forming)